MSKIWVLGDGQLGAMLRHAGMPLDVEVCPIDINADVLPELSPEDKVTAEREQWPSTPVTQALEQHPNFLNRLVFPKLADRVTQKQLLDDLDLSTAPWMIVSDGVDESSIHRQLGDNVLLKRRSGGYDGRGQHWLRSCNDDKIPADWHDHAIAEQAINFDEEVSLIGARDIKGNVVFFPITLNLNTDGILMATVAPVDRIAHLQAEAERMLGKLLESLDYVGVLAMEAFRLGDSLMINELAPRVHNTGHWTQAGSSISQFEYHVRAVAGYPTVPAKIKAPSVMINLIGTPWDERWLAIEGAEVYWYGKDHRPGRKLGHINFCNSNTAQISSQLNQLKDLLPEQYQPAIQWVQTNLTP